jgi:integrase
MKQKIEDYIASKQLAWSPSTLSSERSRLLKLAPHIELGPRALYDKLIEDSAPYTVKTSFIRISALMEWMNVENEFKDFMQSHARLFKHSYKREVLKLDYEEAFKRINSIEEDVVRAHCLFLLKSGLRISESYKVDGDGYVEGKGGKRRKVLVRAPEQLAPAYRVRAALREVGLKPHSLRKLLATKLFRAGFDGVDICKIFGWSNLQTAMNYLQADGDSELASRLAEVV